MRFIFLFLIFVSDLKSFELIIKFNEPEIKLIENLDVQKCYESNLGQKMLIFRKHKRVTEIYNSNLKRKTIKNKDYLKSSFKEIKCSKIGLDIKCISRLKRVPFNLSYTKCLNRMIN